MEHNMDTGTDAPLDRSIDRRSLLSRSRHHSRVILRVLAVFRLERGRRRRGKYNSNVHPIAACVPPRENIETD
jgi:hypothetical protein